LYCYVLIKTRGNVKLFLWCNKHSIYANKVPGNENAVGRICTHIRPLQDPDRFCTKHT